MNEPEAPVPIVTTEPPVLATGPRPHLSQAELECYDLTHEKGGNGLAFLEELGDEYCRVIKFGRSSIDTQAFVAWKPCLTLTTIDGGPQKLPEAVLELLEPLREALRNGTKQVVATRFVECATH